MAGFFQAEGIVLRNRDYRETDQLLTILTASHGKVDAIVKGVRKPSSSLRSGTQQLCRSRFLFYAGKNLATVTQCQVQSIFPFVRQDLKLLAYAYYLVEIADSVVMSGQVNPGMYNLLNQGLTFLAEFEPELVARYFEARTLKILGLEPRLNCCAVCENPLQGVKQIVISPAAGGVLCLQCQGKHGKEYRVVQGSIKIWQQFYRVNWQQLKRLKISSLLKQELEEVIPAFLEYYLDRKLKSRSFMSEIGGDSIDDRAGQNRPVTQTSGN